VRTARHGWRGPGPVAAGAVGAAALTAHTVLNAALLRRPTPAPAPDELVSVLVPARDEEERIGACLDALLATRGAALEVLVLDDGSADATAEIVADRAARDPRVRLLPGAPLPGGWLGKPHACAQLAAAARGRILAFVDADVRVAPHGIAAAAALLRGAGLDLVSPYPRQLADGAGPRLVQPLLQWLWLTFVPLRLAEVLGLRSMAVAGGQFLVCDAAAYRRAGGHAAVRGEVLEDVALARAFAGAGARVALADGTDLADCRMYGSWAEVRDGYTKSLWSAFPSPAGAAAAMGLLVLLYVVPPAALVAGLARGRVPAAALAGTAAGVAGRVVAARRTGGRPADALAHPLSVLALVWLTARSWQARRAGRLTWKGRVLGAAAPAVRP